MHSPACYCMWTPRLSLASNRLPRALGINGAYSRLVVAALGIIAGSGFATTELRLLLLDVAIDLDARWPHLDVTLYVDDMMLEVLAKRRMEAARMLAQAVDHVAWLVFGKLLRFGVFWKEIRYGRMCALHGQISCQAHRVREAHTTLERL